ncbi:MAG: hypothetical protein ACXVVU_17060 [Solirubrobacteraceae bacterium]
MRPTVAFLGVSGLLLVAGFGLLSVVTPVLRSWRHAIAAAGLAYLVGASAVLLSVIALLTAGVGLRLSAVAACALALALVGGLLGLRYGPRPDSSDPTAARVTGTRADRLVLVVFTVLFALFAAATLTHYLIAPLDTWDGWSIWTRKAIVLSSGSLDPRLFTAPAYVFVHQDYPLLVPLLEALYFRPSGTLDTERVHLVFWALLVAFPWALAYLSSRTGRPVIWAPIVLAAATAPALQAGLVTAYADVPLAIFLATGVLTLGFWVEGRSRRDLAIAVILLAGAASTKNEGTVAAVLALGVAALVAFARTPRSNGRDFGTAVLAFVLAIAPWHIWTAAHGIKSDISIGNAVDPGFLAGRSDRIWPAVQGLYVQLQDQGAWFYLLPLAILVAGAAIALRRDRRVGAFYALTGVGFFVALVWVYWISPLDIALHVRTSAYRVVDGVGAIAIAALAHLAPRLVEAGRSITGAGAGGETTDAPPEHAPAGRRPAVAAGD